MQVHIKNRIDKFSELYQASGNIYQSAIKAGYSENVAKSKGKWLVGKAERRLQETVNSLPVSEKKTMAEIVGFSKEKLMERLYNIGIQERDLSTALKVLAPLAKEYDVDLTPSNDAITVPVLNISVSNIPRNMAQPQRIRDIQEAEKE
jgi:hypothetical protein